MKVPTSVLGETRASFTLAFWSRYSIVGSSEIYNMDETSIYLDMFPRRIWSVRGRSGSSKVAEFTRYPARMTAVLTIRVDGT